GSLAGPPAARRGRAHAAQRGRHDPPPVARRVPADGWRERRVFRTAWAAPRGPGRRQYVGTGVSWTRGLDGLPVLKPARERMETMRTVAWAGNLRIISEYMYRIEELPEKIQERAWMVWAEAQDYSWDAENRQSLEAFSDLFGVSVRDWRYGGGRPYISYDVP